MAGYYNSRYQYETSPRKLQPEYKPSSKKYPKKSTAKKTKEVSNKREKKQVRTKVKRHLKKKIKIVSYVMIGFAILFAISYRNSIINEKFSEIKTLKSNLASIEKENEQLKVNVENNLNLKSIEQSAQEMLGMQKLESSQTVYINLPKEDYIEPATEEIIKDDNSNWFEKIISFILGK